MNINTWLYGCRVSVTDWVGKDADGKTPIRIGVEYFRPGSSISHPAWERVIYCARRDEQTVRDRLDSIVWGICSGAIPTKEARV